jgi:hypothetical protein
MFVVSFDPSSTHKASTHFWAMLTFIRQSAARHIVPHAGKLSAFNAVQRCPGVVRALSSVPKTMKVRTNACFVPHVVVQCHRRVLQELIPTYCYNNLLCTNFTFSGKTVYV